MNAVLVYQNGIANVFAVDVPRATHDPAGEPRRNARRLLQHAFSPCYWFARGLQQAGWTVHTAWCPVAGDIVNADWTTPRADAPFSASEDMRECGRVLAAEGGAE